MIIYTCNECEQTELAYKVIPKLICPRCGKFMDAEEQE